MRFLLIGLLMFAASCSTQRIYLPDRAASFAFREAGEAKVIASLKPQLTNYDSMGKSRGGQSAFAADAGYSITPHLLVFGAYRGVNRLYGGEAIDGFSGEFNGRRVEGGAGYFSTYGRRGLAELLAGFGNGYLERRGTDAARDFRTRYNRYFAQGALGFGGETGSLMGGMRLALQHYYAFDSPDPDLRYAIMNRKDVGRGRAITEEPLSVLEPFIGGEVGYKWVRFSAQTGISMRYTGPRFGGYVPMYFHFGIAAHYAPRFRSSKD